jgi:hypothetical protein
MSPHYAKVLYVANRGYQNRGAEMQKHSVSFSTYSIAGESYAVGDRTIQVGFTMHTRDTEDFNSGGILGSQDYNLTIEEAEELMELLTKALKHSKAYNKAMKEALVA